MIAFPHLVIKILLDVISVLGTSLGHGYEVE